MAELRSVDEHLSQILSTVTRLAPMEVTLVDARGCRLSVDLSAPSSLPRFDNSAMDGYAVRASDLEGASDQNPVDLPVVGDIAAGDPGGLSVRPGLCVRIMTGAPVPPGADAVVPVEWTDGGVAKVRITRAPDVGAHVRHVGEDLKAGELVLAAGTELGAAQLGLLAASGYRSVPVHPRPRVVVLSTGSELVEPGDEVGPGQIVDANGYALTAAATASGAQAYRAGIVRDDARTLLAVLEDHLIQADLVITSGGVSVGAYDVVKEVLTRIGTVGFHKVAMQPGMPQGFGVLGPDRVPIFGLPGNPVSALVSFEVFVRPAIRQMLGASPHPQLISARLLQDVTGSPLGRRQYLRSRVEIVDGAYAVRLVGGTGSHLLAGMAAADSLVVVDEHTEQVAAGQPVPVLMLDRP